MTAVGCVKVKVRYYLDFITSDIDFDSACHFL